MPLVSIVTATFNRSNVLRFAIESVLASTVTDWELIVVGDACTDDSEAVVHSFDDPRITFVNLPVNSGEQSTPNNEGVRLTRAPFVAFLNHDDLWGPAHLQNCLDAIPGADLVWTATVVIDPAGRIRIAGLCPRGEYHPGVVAPASSWFVRRSLFERIGPWRPARTMYNVPSQEWLFRAWKSGARLRPIDTADLIAVSSDRAGSYADRHEKEIAQYARMLRSDPECFARLLEIAALEAAAERAGETAGTKLRRAVQAGVMELLAAVRLHPVSFLMWLRYGHRGGKIDDLRRMRGLAPLDPGGKP